MIALDLPSEIEKHFHNIVEDNYKGNIQDAMISLLKLHDKYAWKEQLRQDVNSIRKEVKRTGGISSKKIDATIKKCRKNSGQ